jgi:hypothetical protein
MSRAGEGLGMPSEGRTLRFTKVDDLLLVVHALVDPDPHEWSAMIAESRARAHGYRRVLVVASNVRLKASQRSELADFVNSNDVKVAVLVDSAVARGMVTALGWVTGKYRAFPTDDIEAAIAYLGGHLDIAIVRDEVRSMQRDLLQGRSATA